MDESDPAAHRGPSGLNASVLVLNRHYVAVRVVNARRAISLLFKSCAEVIDHDEGQFVNFTFDGWVVYSMSSYDPQREGAPYIRTPRFAILVPPVIRLMMYDKVPKFGVKFNRKNILFRDDHRCQYCGRRFAASKLSVDHVVPRSRGGKSCWTNVVVSCNPCNTRKGGRLPSEAGMRLVRDPVVPLRNPFIIDGFRNGQREVWRYFVKGLDESRAG